MTWTDLAYRAARPLVFRMDAERAHHRALALLARRAPPRVVAVDARLATQVAGLDFAHPVGLAAGLDKDGVAIGGLFRMGFGAVEIGTLTPLPQPGNPAPRLFRLAQDRAIINRFGFNNGGQAAAVDRIAALRARHHLPGPLGINIGANKDARDRIADYAAGVAAMGPLADYLTVNISSPNTPGLRALQDKGALDALLSAVMAARATLGHGRRGRPVPIFLKVAPDLTPDDVDDIVALAMAHRLDALIISNTTITRPPLHSAAADETGGLSGAPLRDLAHQRLADFAAASGGALPLIGVGGIASAADAYARIRAGASLVQIYSALIYEGPGLPQRMAAGLSAFLRRDGLASITQAVGIDRTRVR